MSVLPEGKLARVQYCESHNPIWLAAATTIGTTVVAVNSLIDKTDDARAAFAEQQSAIDAAKAATVNFHQKVAAMTTAAADILKEIKAAGAVNPAVFVSAQVPPPATPGPVAPPAMPTDFRVSLNPDGSLVLTWKASNPSGAQGTVYQVFRKVGAGEFMFAGVSGIKKFIDATLPSTTGPVTYKVSGTRSTATGTANTVTVMFGTGGSGETMIANVTTPRIAA